MRPFDIVGIIAVLSWVGWMGFMVISSGEDGLGEVERLELSDEDRKAGWRDGVEWQGIYLKDQKVGYVRLKKWREAAGHFIESDMVMHLTVMRTRQKITTKMRARLSADLVLETFELDIKSGPADMRMEGRVEGTRVHMSIDSGGGIQEETIELKEPPRLSASLKPLLMRSDLKAGDQMAMSFFDPASMTERDLVFEYRGKEKMVIMDHELDAYHFTQRMGGIQFDLWTNSIGEVLREDLPMGLVGLRESSVEARYGVASGTVSSTEDMVDAVSVVTSGRAFPQAAREVVLELSGLNFEGLDLDGGRQSWAPSPDRISGRLTLKLEDMAVGRGKTIGEVAQLAEGKGSLAEVLKAAVSPELMIQSDNSTLVHGAYNAAGASPADIHEKEVLEIAERISTWAYEHIKKESVVGVPSALETLRTLRGDCNEHTTLVVGLLRALGVPARPTVGIAYLPDRDRFFYHAWVEVWDGGWVAIDPTFGQFPADIGHVRFVVGGLSEQVEMFRVIGQLKMHHP